MIQPINDFADAPKDIKTELAKRLLDLYLVSETDEALEVLEIEKENPDQVFNIEYISKKLNAKSELLQIYAVETFFENLINIEEWYGEYEIGQAKLFLELMQFLNENLTNMSIIEIGEINIQVYLVGQSDKNRWLGFNTSKIQT